MRTLGSGDGFGEVALLMETAHTATVTARGDLHLRALPGGDFVAAITQSQLAAKEATATVTPLLDEDRHAVARRPPLAPF